MIPLLAAAPAVADALAILFAPHVEAVVHDLASDRIEHIAGNFSRRRVGDPSLTDTADLRPFAAQVIGPYSKVNWDGRSLRSLSVVLHDREGAPAGLLCINVDVSAFEAARRALDALLRLPEAALPRAQTLFPSDWREAMNAVMADFLAERSTTLAGLTIDGEVALLARLETKGLLAVRGAVNYAAEMLGCSRATLYKRLAAARAEKEQVA